MPYAEFLRIPSTRRTRVINRKLELEEKRKQQLEASRRR